MKVTLMRKRQVRGWARERATTFLAALSREPLPGYIAQLYGEERAIYQQELLDILRRFKKQYDKTKP